MLMDASATVRMPLLAVERLRHVYRVADVPDRLILDDVSFTLRANEIVALLGRSGCGKSTLLLMDAGSTAPPVKWPWCSRALRCSPG
jgi:NitT/TauT family transport system ATP-binding protein